VKPLLAVLVAIYMLGVFANGAVIQYVEDPYGCKTNSSSGSVFICPWSPEREEDPNQREITRRMLLWPAYMVEMFANLSEDETPYPFSH
jgi:hypothetical protein